MPTLTVTDIDIGREYRVFAVENQDGTTTIFATLNAKLQITEAEHGLVVSRTVELTGTARTRAIALFNDIKTLAKAEWGIA